MISNKEIVKFLRVLIKYLIGGFFIFAAWVKTESFLAFQIQIFDLGISNWTYSNYSAYVIVCTELFAGLSIVVGFHLRRLVYPFLLIMLGVFSAVLLYQIFFRPDIMDCGCMGAFLPLTPVQSLMKNFLLACIIWWLYKNEKTYEILQYGILSILLVISITVPIYRTWDQLDKGSIEIQNAVNYPFDLKRLYSNSSDSTQVSLEKGKWVVPLLSQDCNQCKIAAKKINLIHRSKPEIHFHAIIYGEHDAARNFMIKYGISQLPFTSTANYIDMLVFSANKVPIFLWLEDGIVVKKSYVKDLNSEEIEAWMASK